MAIRRISYIIFFFIVVFLSRGFSFAQESTIRSDLHKAIDAFQNQDFNSAIKYFDKVEPFLEIMDEQSKNMIPFFMGSCYFNMEDYYKALPYFESVHNLSKDEKIQKDIKPNLLTIYSTLGDTISASSCVNEMLSFFNDDDFIQSGCYSNYAIALNTYYMGMSQYDKALEVAEKCLSVIDLEYKNEQLREIQKFALLNSSGRSNLELQNYKQACTDFKNALQHSSYVDTLSKIENITRIGIAFDYTNMLDSALFYFSEAEKFYDSYNGQITTDRVVNALSIGVTLMQVGEYLKARQYLSIAMDGYLILDEKEYIAYSCSHLYNCLYGIGDKDHLYKCSGLIKKYINQVKVDNGRIANICYSTYASILESEGNIEGAISVMNDVIVENSKKTKVDPYSLASCYYKQGCLMLKKKDYFHAEEYINKALALIQPLRENFRDLYIKTAVCYAEILEKKDCLGKSIAWMENLLPFVEENQSHDSMVNSSFYVYLSSLYARIGNYENFLKYSLLDSDNILKKMGADSYLYACSLMNLYEAFMVNQQKENADDCLNKAERIVRIHFGDESKEYYDIVRKKSISCIYDSSKKNPEKNYLRKLSSYRKNCMELIQEIMPSIFVGTACLSYM